jgi:hypothetical protein
MKNTRHAINRTLAFSKIQGAVLLLVVVFGLSCRAGALTTAALYSLPETSAAANYVSTITSEALPSKESLTLRQRLAISVIEAGFLIGTTTAVHELGHASRVRAMGGRSTWETGDVNWWSYLAHRDPLAAGVTDWKIPRVINVNERISIAAAGFNATTSWDESIAGKGPFWMMPARYSTLLYAFSGVSTDDNDLTQIEGLYAKKGFRITPYEMQGWQLLAGCIGQLNTAVKTYAYFTPSGVSLRAVTQLSGWSLATEAVVHGQSNMEVELGRKLNLGSKVDLFPKILVSPHGVGGSLKAGVHFRQSTLSMNCQWVNPSTLLGTRSTTSFDMQFAMSL